MNLDILQKNLGYSFKDISILKNALCHTSYAHESSENLKSNERLEFLGDTILNFSISDILYKHQPSIKEGDMSKIRALVICEETLYEAAMKLEYYNFIMLGKGEEKLNGNKKASILADAFEAIIAAIYMDSDFQTAYEFVIRILGEKTKEAIGDLGHSDYKTTLQEVLQHGSTEKISYEIVEESGPDHDKKYVSIVKLGENVLGKGTGSSKKLSEQEAAKDALQKLKK